jgi:23S rRNA pseudouridine1911/1915/1917 synthase
MNSNDGSTLMQTENPHPRPSASPDKDRDGSIKSAIRNPQSAIPILPSLLDIIFEDADLLVVNKPAGLVCHPTKDGELSSLLGRARLYLGAVARLVNRLDRETSGVTVVAKSSAAAGELGKLWEKRAVRKEYIAIVHGTVREDSGAVDLPLGKDEKSQVAVKDCARPDGAAARTEFLVERRFQRGGRDFSLLRLLPRTGRKHQIRIHLAALGHPIVGDKLYGGNEDLYLALAQDRLTALQRQELILPNHALHADSLGFDWRGAEKAFRAPPNPDFAAFASGS